MNPAGTSKLCCRFTNFYPSITQGLEINNQCVNQGEGGVLIRNPLETHLDTERKAVGPSGGVEGVLRGTRRHNDDAF